MFAGGRVGLCLCDVLCVAAVFNCVCGCIVMYYRVCVLVVCLFVRLCVDYYIVNCSMIVFECICRCLRLLFGFAVCGRVYVVCV